MFEHKHGFEKVKEAARCFAPTSEIAANLIRLAEERLKTSRYDYGNASMYLMRRIQDGIHFNRWPVDKC